MCLDNLFIFKNRICWSVISLWEKKNINMYIFIIILNIFYQLKTIKRDKKIVYTHLNKYPLDHCGICIFLSREIRWLWKIK